MKKYKIIIIKLYKRTMLVTKINNNSFRNLKSSLPSNLLF